MSVPAPIPVPSARRGVGAAALAGAALWLAGAQAQETPRVPLPRGAIHLAEVCPADVVDATPCAQAAIDAVGRQGSGEVYVGERPGGWRFRGTLQVRQSGLHWRCASRQTVLTFDNRDRDDFRIGHGAEQIANIAFDGCYFDHVGKTGGRAFDIRNVAELLFDNVVIDHAFDGVYAEKTNSVSFRDVDINAPRGAFAWKFFADPDKGERSDLVTFYDSVANCQYGGGDGLVVDGFVNTVRAFGLALLQTRRGLDVRNTPGSRSGYPSFFEMFDLEVDGASEAGVLVEAGSNLYFEGSDLSNTSGTPEQGGRDGPAVVVLPDEGASRTHQLTFVGGRISNSQKEAAVIDAKDVTVTGVLFTDASKAGVGAYPALRIGPHAANVSLTGGLAGTLHGLPARTSYGLVIEAGAKAVTVLGMNFPGNVRGAVMNEAEDPLSTLNGNTGFGAARFEQQAFNKDVVTGRLVNRASNAAVRYELETGSPGSSAAMTLRPEGRGSAFDMSFGAAVRDTRWRANLAVDGLKLPAAPPPSASAPCETGQIQWDPGFVYVCVGPNEWRRTALKAF